MDCLVERLPPVLLVPGGDDQADAELSQELTLPSDSKFKLRVDPKLSLEAENRISTPIALGLLVHSAPRAVPQIAKEPRLASASLQGNPKGAR